jgi:hypothetical protein
VLSPSTKTKSPAFLRGFFYAEKEGFEPTVGSSPTTVFKTVPLNRSGISPWAKIEKQNTLPSLSAINNLKQRELQMKKAFKRKPVLRSKALKTVPGKGLEPPCLAALVPETSTSTNFATRANKFDNSQTNSVSDGVKIEVQL